jgi:hypothetical protein
MLPKLSLLRILVLSLLLLAPAVGARADSLPGWLPPSTQVGIAGPQADPNAITAGMLANNSATVLTAGDTVQFMNGSMAIGMWEWSWDTITLDLDPFVTFVGGFKNVGEMPMDFVFSTSTPISPALAATRYGGSTIVTYADASFGNDGGFFDDGNNPVYAGTIDTNEVLDLLASVSLTPDFAGDASKFATETQGLPPSIPGPAANSSIGIIHRFNLSAGDQATFNSTFQVVPEPGSFALLAAGLCGLALLGRRRQS